MMDNAELFIACIINHIGLLVVMGARRNFCKRGGGGVGASPKKAPYPYGEKIPSIRRKKQQDPRMAPIWRKKVAGTSPMHIEPFFGGVIFQRGTIPILAPPPTPNCGRPY